VIEEAGQGVGLYGPTRSVERLLAVSSTPSRDPPAASGPLRGASARTRTEFSITPIGTGESVGDLVAETVRIVRASGLPNETNAMFTNLEGEWDEIMTVIKPCVDTMAQAAPRPAFRWW
jgi:uncharacterized protein YqgV (UPF0045/DUF77 family)